MYLTHENTMIEMNTLVPFSLGKNDTVEVLKSCTVR